MNEAQSKRHKATKTITTWNTCAQYSSNQKVL